MWAFMKAKKFSSIELPSSIICAGIADIPTGHGQPQRFIPVFDMYEDAVKFAGSDTHLIMELVTIPDNARKAGD